MEFFSARQAIHDAYAIHMRSKGFEPAAAVFARGDRSMDADRLIWDIKDAGKVIAVVENLPLHLKAWCYWCYSPLGNSNQSWFKQIDSQARVRNCRSEADRLSAMAAGLPDRIARCKTDARRAELQAIDTDELMTQAATLADLADRLERSQRQPDPCAPLWNWLDVQIAERAPEKIRKKTLLHVRDVCRASAYNYRYQIVAGIQKPLMSRKVVCERFGVPYSHFERDYRKWMNWSADLCSELDREALLPVAAVFGHWARLMVSNG